MKNKSNFLIIVFLAATLSSKVAAVAEQTISSSTLCSIDNNQLSFNQNIGLRTKTTDKKTLTVLTWNAHKFADANFFWDIKKLSEKSDLIFIQEAMHSTGWQNAFASHMHFDWSFHKSFCTNEQATGVMTGSRFLQVSPRTQVSSGTEPILFTHKVSGVSYIQFQNKKIMLINTHALNFNLGADFEDQIDQLIELISRTNLPIIWSGDFNTWSADRRAYLFNQAISQGLDPLIPKSDPRFLQLDHILVRGFTSVRTEVLTQFKSSDHFPVMTQLVLQ